MVRLYFDVFDGELISRDKEGTCFESIEAARQAAAQSLLELMKSRTAASDAAELLVVARDDSDETAFTARLLLLIS
jgi:hypothetical protein